jgi:hypothetical protein
MITILNIKIGSENLLYKNWLKIKRNYNINECDLEEYRKKILYKARKHIENPIVDFNYIKK